MSGTKPVAPEPGATQLAAGQWGKVLVDGHASLVRARHLFRHLPSAPRCKVCGNPFAGAGGRVLGLAGFRPSRKNPSVSVNAGVAYVGNVGEAVVDFTALGDPVNVAARMQQLAAGGELLVAKGVADELAADAPRRTLTLRGRQAPLDAFVLTA